MEKHELLIVLISGSFKIFALYNVPPLLVIKRTSVMSGTYWDFDGNSFKWM